MASLGSLTRLWSWASDSLSQWLLNMSAEICLRAAPWVKITEHDTKYINSDIFPDLFMDLLCPCIHHGEVWPPALVVVVWWCDDATDTHHEPLSESNQGIGLMVSSGVHCSCLVHQTGFRLPETLYCANFSIPSCLSVPVSFRKRARLSTATHYFHATEAPSWLNRNY